MANGAGQQGESVTPPLFEPKVSVCVVTYNHEKYIRECLQSVVEQETNFDFEVIVGDDCSSDSTRAIISEFENQFPDKIRALYHPNKVGGTQNYLLVHAAARGQYIAHLDGDDYCLPGKLQAQVDYLEDHAEVSLATHAVNIVINNRISEKIFGGDPDLPERASIVDLLKIGTYFTNSSVMYRASNRFNHNIDRFYVDFYMHIEQASRGLIFLDKRVFGCYRVHDQGITKSPTQKAVIENGYEEAFDRAIELSVPYEIVQPARLRRRMVFAIEHYLAGDMDGYLKHIFIEDFNLKYATIKHKLLFHFRRLPFVIDLYFVKDLMTRKLKKTT